MTGYENRGDGKKRKRLPVIKHPLDRSEYAKANTD